jgi:hypothetical protein
MKILDLARLVKVVAGRPASDADSELHLALRSTIACARSADDVVSVLRTAEAILVQAGSGHDATGLARHAAFLADEFGRSGADPSWEHVLTALVDAVALLDRDDSSDESEDDEEEDEEDEEDEEEEDEEWSDLFVQKGTRRRQGGTSRDVVRSVRRLEDAIDQLTSTVSSTFVASHAVYLVVTLAGALAAFAMWREWQALALGVP